MLHAFPRVRYVGLDPDTRACHRALATLARCNVDIRHTPVYDVTPSANERFDVVVSFSVLEHVYQRLRYLSACARSMSPGTMMFINYEAGHFMPRLQGNYRWRERFSDWRRVLWARLGNEADYQAFVREVDFRKWITQAGFKVQEKKFFNLAGALSAHQRVDGLEHVDPSS